MVVVFVEGFLLGDAPGVIVAFVKGAGIDGESGDADAGEGEMVGAVIAAGFRARVGDDSEVELLRDGLDCGVEGGALGPVDVDFLLDA